MAPGAAAIAFSPSAAARARADFTARRRTNAGGLAKAPGRPAALAIRRRSGCLAVEAGKAAAASSGVVTANRVDRTPRLLGGAPARFTT